MNRPRVRMRVRGDIQELVLGSLHAARAACAAYYRAGHSEVIELWPLLVQMLRTFLDADRAF